MGAIFVPAGELPQLEAALLQLQQDTTTKGVLVLMADAGHFTHEVIRPVVQACPLKVIGGVFPEVIYQGQRKAAGTVVIPLRNELSLARILLADPQGDVAVQLADTLGEVSLDTHALLVFCDALAPGKTRFIEELFNHFGAHAAYLGSGVGSLRFQSFPCVLDNEGLHSNSAVVALSNKRIAMGVAHGWHALTEPMKVTKADGNKVLGINWRPAFEVYKQVVEQHAGRQFTDANFFDIAKSYPLGIARIDTESIIRDPFMVEGNAIHIVDVIHEGEFVSIMHGNMDSLLAGAQKAADLSAQKADAQQTNRFCIDCISRVLYMQDEFQREIDIIGAGHGINGALSIGEIANDGEGYLEIYNKTIVVARW